MRLLVAGAGGMVGWEIAQRARAAGFDCIALDRRELDVTDGAAVADAMRRVQPDVVINAAAYTAVDGAESNRDEAMLINSDGAGNLARSAQAAGAAIVQISTDYVFDGTASTPYPVDHPPHPLGVYGESKLAGEEQVRNAAGTFAIVRTSWVFSNRGQNFMMTMLRLKAGAQTVRVVDDQTARPTAAGDLAEALLAVGASMHDNRGIAGIWHFANAGEATWYEFAKAIFEFRGGNAEVISPVSTEQFPTIARRPAYSVLDTASFEKTYGARPRHWRDALRATLETMT